jgi:Mrp family chromosome partitioning ATPase
MENIRQAIERAKGSRLGPAQVEELAGPVISDPPFRPDLIAPTPPRFEGTEVALNSAQLESRRIIAHDIADPRAKSFDMLRTQVLQAMELKSWQMLGVTSPTAGCGKTVLAINLAMSIARQNRPVLLIDLDLQKPQVANYLGLAGKQGLLSVLEGRTDFASSIIEARVRSQRMSVLPCEASTLNSSEWMASRSMDAVMQQIKRDYKDCVVVFDLPPVLAGDDVITILPQLDCVLFVAAVGTTTVSDIKEANKHLELASIVRFVLNKSAEMPATYYSRYAENLYHAHKKRRRAK